MKSERPRSFTLVTHILSIWVYNVQRMKSDSDAASTIWTHVQASSVFVREASPSHFCLLLLPVLAPLPHRCRLTHKLPLQVQADPRRSYRMVFAPETPITWISRPYRSKEPPYLNA